MVAPPPGGGPGSGNPYANGGMAGQKNAMYVGASGTNPNAWADRYKTEQTDFAGYGGYDFRAGPSKPLVPASQWRNDNGPSSGGAYRPGIDPPEQRPGYGQQPGDTSPGSGSGGGHYGGGGSGGVTPPGSTTPPSTGTPGTATGPLFSKADTDRAVSQSAANAFSQGDSYSLRTAASGNGLSYGAGQAGMINPLVSQAGVNARSAAKSIPIQDAMANEQWMLGNQVQQGQSALDWARLGEYRNQTGQMGDDFFVKLLMSML
jgi:hypothetical protein